jgi:competence protein ComEC
VQLQFLYPPIDFLDKRKKEKWRNPNNNSIVVKVLFGSKSILFPGDIQARAERELVAVAGDNLKSTVLIAPHHGSRSSSTAEFLDTVKPEFVIMSSGGQSRYMFPHPSVLQRYTKRGCRILRTDCNGALTLFTDGRSLKIKPAVMVVN